MTVQEIEVIERMKRGHYLVRSEHCEGLTLTYANTLKVSYPVKCGTITSLEREGLIKKCRSGKKWLLTDKGMNLHSEKQRQIKVNHA